MWQGGVGQGVAEGFWWCLIADWKVSRRMLLALLLGVSMVVLDRGMGWEVSGRVLGCRW